MADTSKDRAHWLLLPAMLLALSGVTLLAPRHAAQAVSPTTPAASKPAPALAEYDDGDGDELLEHWGDPKYASEERLQLSGIAGGFLLLGGLAFRRRQTQSRGLTLSLTTPAETNAVSEQRKAA